jgi:DNA-directed RNA polymerase subunit RPC12/RpoP
MNYPRGEPVDFVCASCGAKLKAKPEKAGASLPCPKCKQVVHVPAVAEVVEDQAEAFPASFEGTRTYVSDWKPPEKKGLTLLGQFGIVLVVALGAFFLFVVAISPDVRKQIKTSTAPAVASPELQEQRRRLIQDLIDKGVFYKVEGNDLYVDLAFAVTTVDQKNGFLNMFYAYVNELPRVGGTTNCRYPYVYAKDKYTGKTLFYWSPTTGLVAE